MKIGVNVTDIDKGYSKVLKNFRKLGYHVDIGVFGDEAGGEMVIIAYVQEYGNPSNTYYGKALAPIPARPFLRNTFDRKKKLILQHMEKMAKRVFDGKMKPEQYFNSIGEYVRGLVQKFMRDSGEGTYRPNKELTVDKKGSSVPLIDEGHLLDSITFKISRNK